MSKFYVTNAIPYVNAKPHIGHAYEFVLSDIIARYHKLKGDETALLCGGDENALKNVQAAEKEGENVQKFVDKNSKLFGELAKKLNVDFDVFQKGSAENHKIASQKLWQLCQHDIYKKTYTGLYCVGCEQFYEPDELDEKGECFEHPGKKLEEVSEENYFFALSRYTDQIKEKIESGELKIFPDFRKNEVLSFLKQGLKDISISRSNERAKNWGVTVPGDETQKMYVWFDALNIYQSGIGFGTNEEEYKKWWPADVHVLGKGIIRFHAIYWPAFLISAGLPLPRSLFVHGYLTVNGQKMSKTVGNVVDPLTIIEKYGIDPLRYYFAREIPSTDDGDFSEKRLVEIYNSELANELGNLVSRVSKLAELAGLEIESKEVDPALLYEKFNLESELLEVYSFDQFVKAIRSRINEANETINREVLWEKIKGDKEGGKKVLTLLIEAIKEIAVQLKPIIPETAEKIEEQFKGPKITSSEPLFPRIKF